MKCPKNQTRTSFDLYSFSLYNVYKANNENMVEKTQTGQEAVQENIKDYLSKDRSSLDQEDFSNSAGKKKKKFLVLGALLILLIVLAFSYISYTTGQKSFANEEVNLSIESPENIESGEEISFTIAYKNDNDIALKNVKIEMFFPENFTLSSSDKSLEKDGSISFWKSEEIPAHSTDRIRVFGRMMGDMGDEKIFRAIMKYKPANFNSEFQANAEKRMTVTSVPVELSLKIPENGIKNDADAMLQFYIKNKSERSFSKGRIDIELPETFTLISSESPVTQKDRRYSFELDNMSPGTEKSVSLQGSFHSENGTETIKMEFYATENGENAVKYAQKTEEIKIIKPEILVTAKINGEDEYYASKNEEIEYRINFKNQSEKEIRGLTLTSSLSGNFDFSSIKAERGRVNGNEITWSALNVPALGQLKPGEEGNVSFKVKVKDYFDITKETDKDFVLENIITIKTSSQEIMSLTESTKVKAFLALDVKGYFNDDGRIQNGGALPPRVGEKTYYTMHWSIRSLFGSTQNVQIKASLPAGVRWTGKYVDSKGKTREEEGGNPASEDSQGAENTQEEKVYYNAAVNEIIWEIPALKANEGILSPAKEIIFQIEAIPKEDDAGKIIDLLDISTALGYDIFTKQTVSSSQDKVTSRLVDDYSISDNEAVVQGR